jgi:hypothetical protein
MNPEPMLFVKSKCPRCDEIKKILGDVGFSVYDVDTVDGLTEAAFYGLIGKEVPLLLFFHDGNSTIISDPGEIVYHIASERHGVKLSCSDGTCMI